MKFSKTFLEQKYAGVPDGVIVKALTEKITQLESINDESEYIHSALLELKALKAQLSKEFEEVPSFSM